MKHVPVQLMQQLFTARAGEDRNSSSGEISGEAASLRD
jgi:hypothetical protein